MSSLQTGPESNSEAALNKLWHSMSNFLAGMDELIPKPASCYDKKKFHTHRRSVYLCKKTEKTPLQKQQSHLNK
jgi:hypothetical protein